MKSQILVRKPPLLAPAPVPAPNAVSTLASTNLFQAWNRFFFKPLDPVGIGLVRIVGGLLIVMVHLAYTYDLLSYVGGNQAWIDNQTMTFYRSKIHINPPETGWALTEKEIADRQQNPYSKGSFAFSLFFHVDDASTIYFLHGCCLVAMVLFTIGLWTRITAVLTWLACVGYIQRNNAMLFGMDTMMVIWLFYMMIAPAGATFSVDRLLQRWSAKRRGLPVPLVQPSIVANFAMRCMQIHFCLIYFAAGTSKLQGARWWNGTALWEIFANYTFTPMNVPLYHDFLVFLCEHRWLWEIFMEGGAAFTLFLEIGLPFLIWVPSARPYMLMGSVLLHTGIALVMGLVLFSLFMLCLLSAFIPPEAYHYLLGEIGKIMSSQGDEATEA